VHAGEACGAMNVRQAVSDFNADRIGHGVRSIEDESVLALLREKDVMLELCITSNFHTGVVESIEKHPLKLLKDAGVPVSINTDDPAILATTLTDEYVAAVETLSLTESELAEMNIAALKHGFHPDKEKLFKQLRHFWE
ncbi:MAG: adenosine deaminase, partial [bacterium]|nr:adenosine deaminase [bacterium]